MTKETLRKVIIFGFIGLNSISTVGAVSYNATITATIVSPVSITQESSMSFGSFKLTDHDPTNPLTTNLSDSKDSEYGATGSRSNTVLALSGVTGRTCTVSTPSTATLTAAENCGGTRTFNIGVSKADANASYTIGDGNKAEFKGTLPRLLSDQCYGDYNGTFEITFTCI
jgi:hypothetical protein